MNPEQKHRLTQFKAVIEQAWEGIDDPQSPEAMRAGRLVGDLERVFIRPGERELFRQQIWDMDEDAESPYGREFGDIFASAEAAAKRTEPVRPPPRQQGSFLRELTTRTGLPAEWWTNPNLTSAARRKMIRDLKRSNR